MMTIQKLYSKMERLLEVLGMPYNKNRGYFILLVLLFTLSNIYVKRFFIPLVLGMLQSFALAYVLCLILTTIHNRRIRRLTKIGLIIFPFAWSLMDLVCIITTKTSLNEGNIMLMLETDAVEASGFFRQYFSWEKALWIPLFYGMLVWMKVQFLRLWNFLDGYRVVALLLQLLLQICIIVGMAFSIQSYGFIRCKDYTALLVWDGQGGIIPSISQVRQITYADPLIRSVHTYKSFLLLNTGIEAYQKAQADFWNNTASSDTAGDDFNIVVIIGESYIRKHTQIYGYYLPTTPYLQSEKDNGNLVTFSDVISPANYTTISLRNVMNLNSVSEKEQWTESLYFPMLVKKAGWDVYHYDNQAIVGSNDIGLTQVFYTEVNLRHVYSAVNDSLFTDDMDFVKYVDRVWAPKETDRKRMVIYHLTGQHFPYKDHYSGKGTFSYTDITVKKPWLNDERRQLVADYDNATLHNDSVIACLMQRWTDKPTVMFYFGDHGEDVWDLGEASARNKVSDKDPQWLDRQYHIPFMIWMSDSFMDKFQDKASAIRMASDKKGGTTDLLGYMILGMTCTDSLYYKPERDLLNPSYVPQVRITAEGYEYDKVVCQQGDSISEPLL